MKKNPKKPPKIAEFLLKLMAPDNFYRSAPGDFEEIFGIMCEEKGNIYAWFWYWLQLFKSLPSFVIDTIFRSLIMVHNYLMVTLRNLLKHKGFSFINISGLAIGLSCCILIGVWVLDEISYDRFHKNAGRLYKVAAKLTYLGEDTRVDGTPAPLGPVLKSDYPEIENAARFDNISIKLVRAEDKAFYENNIVCVDPSFFKMFSFSFKTGNTETPLDNPNSVVITQDMAEKYFGNENPVGKILTFDNQNSYTVSAVLERIPHNSHVQFGIALPWRYLESSYWYNPDNWGDFGYKTYVLLNREASEKDVSGKIKNVITEHSEQARSESYLMPLTDIRLYSDFYGNNGTIVYVYIFSIIASFVLLIACINFMNLSTARSANRSKEIGIRKVVGAMKSNLIRQFFGESVFNAFVAMLLAVVFASLLLPIFNNLSGKNLSFSTIPYPTILVSGLILITILTGIIAGSYPALYLSSFQPVKMLKGKLAGGAKSSRLRKILVITQFALSTFHIIGTWVVFSQLKFMQNKNIGWDKENLIYIRMLGDINQSYERLRNELINSPYIVSVCRTTYLPSKFGAKEGSFKWNGKSDDEKIDIAKNWADYDFIETVGLELSEGRSFSRDYTSRAANSVLINESFRNLMNLDSAAGGKLWYGTQELEIVGVIKDFNFEALHNELMPMAILFDEKAFNYILVRVTSGDLVGTKAHIQDIWQKVIPDYQLEYHFIEEQFKQMYETESKAGSLLAAFTVLAVFIACLGLFGLASFTAEQRTREIGIRKVLGATAPDISLLLCREFIKLVFIANIIAWPFSFWTMNNWLNDFHYRTQLGLPTFIFTTVLALVVAMLTIIYQALRASFMNPAKAIKHE